MTIALAGSTTDPVISHRTCEREVGPAGRSPRAGARGDAGLLIDERGRIAGHEGGERGVEASPLPATGRDRQTGISWSAAPIPRFGGPRSTTRPSHVIGFAACVTQDELDLLRGPDGAREQGSRCGAWAMIPSSRRSSSPTTSARGPPATALRPGHQSTYSTLDREGPVFSTQESISGKLGGLLWRSGVSGRTDRA